MKDFNTVLKFTGIAVLILLGVAALVYTSNVANAQTVAAKPAAASAPAPTPPAIPAELELAFAQADRDLVAGKLAVKDLEDKRTAAAQALVAACKAPDWGLAMDQTTQRFHCMAAAKEAPKK